MRRKTSAVWRYFDATNNEEAKCEICGHIVPRTKTKGTSNLRHHIQRSHLEEYKVLAAIESRKTATAGRAKTVPSKRFRVPNSWPRKMMTWSEESDTSSSNYYEVLAAEVLKEEDCDGDLPHERLVLRKTSYNEASNSNEQDTLLMPPDAIKRRISTNVADENATEQDQEAEKDDVWNYFEKIPSNRAQCILCKETFNRHVPFLAKHLSEKHRKVALDLPSDSDDDQNCYTEVVYLEEEQPLDVATKLKKIKQVPEPKKRRTSSRYEFANKPKDDEINSKNEVDDEIENFGRYVIGLLKKLPKDVSTQLQMDIISMIMTAKLKIQTQTAENVTVSSVQIVTSGNDIVTTPGNVIVTTPSNVIHTTQNNESLPTLVIGVQKES